MKKAESGKPKAEPRILVFVRDACHDDLDEILACERESFEFPLVRRNFKRIARDPDWGVRVACRGRVVVGHLVYHVAGPAVEIYSLAVAEGVRRRNIGSQLVADLLGLADHGGHREVQCTVRETELVAQLFFRANRFCVYKILKRPYPKFDEDGYSFRYDPNPDQPGQTVNRLAAIEKSREPKAESGGR